MHSDGSLSQLKLDQFARLSTELLQQSLAPGSEGSLKTRQDGTILDGHHRIAVLRSRGVDVDSLPREVIVRE